MIKTELVQRLDLVMYKILLSIQMIIFSLQMKHIKKLRRLLLRVLLPQLQVMVTGIMLMDLVQREQNIQMLLLPSSKRENHKNKNKRNRRVVVSLHPLVVTP